jgi:hypothetical protein
MKNILRKEFRERHMAMKKQTELERLRKENTLLKNKLENLNEKPTTSYKVFFWITIALWVFAIIYGLFKFIILR